MKPLIGATAYANFNLKEEFENIKALGFDFAELSVHGTSKGVNKDSLKELIEILPIKVCHLLDINEDTILEEQKKLIKSFSGVECKTFVIHAPGHFPEEKVIEEQLLVLSELSSFVKEIGCILLLE
ncbi:MAG: hypothetical protein ABH821_00940, partial [archaeon]